MAQKAASVGGAEAARASDHDSSAEAIREEHERLRTLWEASDEVLRCLEADGAAVRPSTAGWVLLQELRTRLVVHFEAEEQGGYFESLRRLAPNLANSIEELEGDHRALTSGLDELVSLADAARDERSRWKTVRLQFEQLRDQAEAHERREDDAIYRAYQIDLGNA